MSGSVGLKGTCTAILEVDKGDILDTVYECLLDEDTIRDETYLSMLQLGASCGSSKNG